MAGAIVFEGFEGVQVSGEEVVTALEAVDELRERVCRVCGAKATKTLEIEVGTTDPQAFLFYPKEVLILDFCDDHAFPQVEFGLRPI